MKHLWGGYFLNKGGHDKPCSADVPFSFHLGGTWQIGILKIKTSHRWPVCRLKATEFTGRRFAAGGIYPPAFPFARLAGVSKAKSLMNNRPLRRPSSALMAVDIKRLGRKPALPAQPSGRLGRRSGCSPAEPYPSPGTYTITRQAIDFYPVTPRQPALNLHKSQWTFHPRKSGHLKPRFCGLFVPLLTFKHQVSIQPG